MQALIYQGPRQMVWGDWPDPVPGPGEAVIEIRAVGICGSDVHGYTGESGRRMPPMIMGHEAAGRVVALGSGVPLVPLGAAVAIQPVVSCGTCDQCRGGSQQRCRHRRFIGGTMPGAMAERVAVPAGNLMPLPDGLSFADAALVEPLAVALHAVRLGGDLTGRSVLVAGSGPIGLLTLVAARRAGARRVSVTDPIPRRREAALELGADAAVDPNSDGWRALLADGSHPTPGEVDVAFDAVGVAATLQQALDVVRPGGTVIALGGWQTVPMPLGPVVAREVRIQGSFNYTSAEFRAALDLLADERPRLRGLITDIHPLAEGAEVFAALARDRGERLKVLLVSADAH